MATPLPRSYTYVLCYMVCIISYIYIYIYRYTDIDLYTERKAWRGHGSGAGGQVDGDRRWRRPASSLSGVCMCAPMYVYVCVYI